jgi:hypothetical protein
MSKLFFINFGLDFLRQTRSLDLSKTLRFSYYLVNLSVLTYLDQLIQMYLTQTRLTLSMSLTYKLSKPLHTSNQTYE